MTVLSLFDGISCARLALDRAGIPVDMYLASEIDKYAITIAKANYPDTIHLGDVRDIDCSKLPVNIDLLIGGSPCQDLSIAKANRKGLDGERSGLFWQYVRILNEVKPKYFILENVNSMPKEAKQTITETLGVEPIMINAGLVSGMQRKRLFWTNISNVQEPKDKGIMLRDVLQDGVIECENDKWVKWLLSEAGQRRIKMGLIAINPDKAITIKAREYANWSGNYIAYPNRLTEIGKGGQGQRIYSAFGKAVSCSANGGGQGAVTGLYLDSIKDGTWLIRKLTPVEVERLFGVPDGYTKKGSVSATQCYKCLGNAFNVDVIAHILRQI